MTAPFTAACIQFTAGPDPERNLDRVSDLIREARDMQGIQDAASRKGGEGKPAAPPASPAAAEPRAERPPRKKN